jgi:methylase of polypeptide subunit release factors
MDKEVKNFEPEIALSAGKTGIEVYKYIIKKVKNFLSPKNAFIIFETDPKTSLKLQGIIKSEFKDSFIKIDKDYNNLDRILTAEVLLK